MVKISRKGSTQKATLVLLARRRTRVRMATKKMRQMRAAISGLMNQLAMMGTMPAG